MEIYNGISPDVPYVLLLYHASYIIRSGESSACPFSQD